MATLPAWFTGPPVVGGANQYQVYEATTQAQYDQYVSDGYKGPYSSASAATSDAASQTKTATSTEISLPNPLAGLEGVSRVIGDIGRALTDGTMWRSLGWVILGIALMLAGVLWWIGPSAARRSPLGVLRENLG